MTTNLNVLVVYGVTFLHLSLAVIYTDQWAVHIEDGPLVADQIANKHGFVNLGKIVADYYHFQHRKVAKRSAESDDVHHTKLVSEPAVRWAEQQTLRRRVKRDFRDVRPRDGPDLNDPLWPQMWYLNRGNGLDMNVQAAWKKGVTGKGIVVTILDDGLERDHPDLKLNYDPFASYDVNNHDDDPQPRYDFVDSNRHGTRCAGEVAAHANNSICTVGIAYEAKVGGVRMLDGDVTDAVEARSLSLNPQHIHIYSASWGPDDDGKTVDGPGELATKAFFEGIVHGRNGLGSIFVWASGNGGRDHDNCNCDGYTNSIWTLSISSATENGLVPWYSEACSSTLASTYSSGSAGEKQVLTTDLRHGCTSTHTGTSASAPLAAGICALALQVNPNLTWRDMQHIVVQTAKPMNLKTADWQVNGVGRNVSHSFGYGLMDAAAMVDLARNWTTVPLQKVCEAQAPYANKLVPAKSKVILTLYVDCPEIRYLEHVQAKVSLAASTRGDIQIYLKSPSGTRSNLLDTRPHDNSPAGFHSWPFMTVHNWGEHPNGIWMLEIHNEGRYEGKARLKDWLLVLYGTDEEPGATLPTTASTTTTTAAATTASTTRRPPFISVSRPKRPPKRPAFHTQRPPILRSSSSSSSTSTTIPATTFTTATAAAATTTMRASFQFPGGRAATLVSAVNSHPVDQGRQINTAAASVKDVKLVLYGTKQDPANPRGDWEGADEDGDEGAVPLNASTACRTHHATGRCLECHDELRLVNGECVAECPGSHFPSTRQTNATVSVPVCLQCHYTCKTCYGPNDYQCVECFADAHLQADSYCRPLDLLHEMNDIQNYGFALTVIVIVLAAVVLLLVACLLCRRRPPDDNGRTYTVLPQASKCLDADKDGANSTRIFLHSDDANDDSQEEM